MRLSTWLGGLAVAVLVGVGVLVWHPWTPPFIVTGAVQQWNQVATKYPGFALKPAWYPTGAVVKYGTIPRPFNDAEVAFWKPGNPDPWSGSISEMRGSGYLVPGKHRQRITLDGQPMITEHWVVPYTGHAHITIVWFQRDGMNVTVQGINLPLADTERIAASIVPHT